MSLKKTTKEPPRHFETTSERLTGMLSIIISWLQILSALTVTYKMSWPAHFAAYSQGTGVIVNLEIMSFLSLGSCQMAVPFINKFLLQMLTPPFFIAAVFSAWLLLKCCYGKRYGWEDVQTARTEYAQSIVVIIIQLVYPKLATRTFQMFRCVDLGPKIGKLLNADFSKTCFTGVHAEYVPYAIVSCVVYLVGLPLITFVILFTNRKKLDSPEIASKFGDLYRKYEKEWYWWECLIMLQKCFLTGAMVAIAPGSPIQLLIALVVCVAYVMLIVYAGPYKGDMEDRLAFVTSLCLATSLLLGLTIIMDKPEPDNVFDMETMGIVLIVINVLPILLLIFDSMLILKIGPTVGIADEHRESSMEDPPSRDSSMEDRPSRESSMDRLERKISLTIERKPSPTKIIPMRKVRARRLSRVNVNGTSAEFF